MLKCDKCGEKKDDAMARLAPKGMQQHWYGEKDLVLDPVLCSLCCSLADRRLWLHADASDS